jgi:lysosomal acid lipase/cholesteryl ester hydrolase
MLLISDWTIRELAMYDLPAMVEHVCRETGYDKVSSTTIAN